MLSSDSSRTIRTLTPSPRRRGGSASGAQDVSLRFLFAVFAQWWKILVPVTLLLLAVTIGLVMFFFQPQYRAAAWLQIKSEQPYVAFPDDKPIDRESSRKYVFTQIELLRSPLILGRALSQPEIAQLPELRRQRDPVNWLATKGLLVTPKGDSELLEVAFAGSDAEAAAKLVDAVVNAYFAIRDEKSDAQIQTVIMLLENEKSRRAEGIKLLQTEIRQLQAQLMAKDPAMVTNTLTAGDVVISDNPLKSIQEDLGRARIDSRILEAQVSALEAPSTRPRRCQRC